jgi:hypothetical protein
LSEFLATNDGLTLTKAFMRIREQRLRRRIVNLVEEIAGDALNRAARATPAVRFKRLKRLARDAGSAMYR